MTKKQNPNSTTERDVTVVVFADKISALAAQLGMRSGELQKYLDRYANECGGEFQIQLQCPTAMRTLRAQITRASYLEWGDVKDRLSDLGDRIDWAKKSLCIHD